MARRREWPAGTDPLVEEVDEIRANGVAAFENPQLIKNIPQIEKAINKHFPNLRPRQKHQGLRKLLNQAIEKLPSNNRSRAASKMLGNSHGDKLPLSARLEAAYAEETGKVCQYHTLRQKSYDKDLVEDIADLLKGIINRSPEVKVDQQDVVQAIATALAAVRQLLPDHDESEQYMLVHSLDYYIPAIEQACQLITIEGSRLSIDGLLRALYLNAALIFNSSGDGSNENLTLKMKILMNDLRNVEPQAAYTLEYMALLGDYVPEELLAIFLAEAVKIEPVHEDLIHAITKRALMVLQQRSMIIIDDDAHVRMQQRLTKDILRSLVLEQNVEEVAARLRSVMLRFLNQVWQQRPLCSGLEFMQSANLIIAHWLCVERAALKAEDWCGAAREVARAITEFTGPFEFGFLVAVTPLLDPEFDGGGLIVNMVSLEGDLDSIELVPAES